MISPPGLTVRGDMILPRYIYWGEAIWQKLLLLAVQTWVGYASKLRGGGEDLNQGAVIQTQEKVVQTQEEELALVYSPGCCSCLPTYRGIS